MLYKYLNETIYFDLCLLTQLTILSSIKVTCHYLRDCGSSYFSQVLIKGLDINDCTISLKKEGKKRKALGFNVFKPYEPKNDCSVINQLKKLYLINLTQPYKFIKYSKLLSHLLNY